ncbi:MULTISPECIES: NADP-dependent oxidoreductase [Brevibacterium]|uniref:NADPH:quinone reductase n=1 Tax=Brevibacterium linens TaxID=1703 RepID=A0A2H1INU8_BRELN|nr:MULTISPECIES: NADP-dependent oxidoreductase [Brevibacterium]AZU00017.1 NADP-dependent oxidoreductase [Brevibacterium linens]SMX76897.1 NADPH:quinone reductase [Brevibacterium linens]
MRAAVYDAYTENFDDITVRELPDPKVPPASVLIEVRAAGVNPVDWKLVGGHLDPVMPTQFPVTPGWDVAGVVVGLGFDTPEFSIGDEVLAYARKDVLGGGTFAEKVAVPVHAVAPKPKSLSWEQAGGLPLAGGTALRTLESLGELEGRTVLIHGASGGVGSFAVQIAGAAGARVIGTASEANHEYLRGLGAEPVTYGDGLVERVLEAAGGKVDGVADFVGGVLDDTLAVLAEDGSHASVTDPSVAEHGGRHIWVRPDGSETARLGLLVDEGKLTVDVAGTYGLDQVPQAFKDSATGHVRGKLVIVP